MEELILIDRIAEDTVFNFVYLVSKDLKKALPIFVSSHEMDLLAMRLTKQKFPRPLTHDLLDRIMSMNSMTVEKLVITKCENGIFFADLSVYFWFHDQPGTTHVFDVRPSDGLILAVKARTCQGENVPIFVKKDVFDTFGIEAILE